MCIALCMQDEQFVIAFASEHGISQDCQHLEQSHENTVKILEEIAAMVAAQPMTDSGGAAPTVLSSEQESLPDNSTTASNPFGVDLISHQTAQQAQDAPLTSSNGKLEVHSQGETA